MLFLFLDHIVTAIITIDIIAKVGAIFRPTNSAQNPVKKKNAITDANNHKIIFKIFILFHVLIFPTHMAFRLRPVFLVGYGLHFYLFEINNQRPEQPSLQTHFPNTSVVQDQSKLAPQVAQV